MKAVLVGVLGILGICSPPAAAGESFSGPSSTTSSTYLEQLSRIADAEQLYDERMWHLLMHYRPDIHGGVTSEADGRDFFLSPLGRNSPRAELQATLAAFFAPDPSDPNRQPAACRFPARYKWLKERLEFDPKELPEKACPDFADWVDGLNPGAVSVVFASSYISAPASMYGHTILRVDRRDTPEMDLLSTGIGFAANPWTTNPFLYVVLGLDGGFPGRFSALPYYARVQEYSNLESRELWSYRLNLTDDQLDWMLRHLWELDTTGIPYYFAKENCSWQILALLDVVAPEAHLVDHFHRVVIPIDTVRAVLNAGMVTSRTVRPSHVNQLRARRDALSRSEAKLAWQLTRFKEPPDWKALHSLKPDRQAAVLDATFDLFKFRYGFKPGKQEEYADDVRRREDVLVAARSEVPSPPTPVNIPLTPAPDAGHLSSRAGAGLSELNGSDAAEIDARLALHDLLDPQPGYSRDSQLEMFSARIRIDSRKLSGTVRPEDGILAERVDLVRVVSMTPWEEWIHPVSFRLAVGGGRVPDIPIASWKNTAADADGGPGLAFSTGFLFHQVYYAYAEAIPAAGPAFRSGWRVTGELPVGVIWEPAWWWRINAEAGPRDDLLGERGDQHHLNYRVDAATSLAMGRNVEFRIQGEWFRGTRETRTALYFSF